MRRTKIVCTIGPASRSTEQLRALIAAGMNVARLNMSHGKREEHAEVITSIRALAAEAGRNIAILLDLSGPKIRLGELREPLPLKPGEHVTLTTESLVGGLIDDEILLPVNYPHLIEELHPGDKVSMADGLILLEIESVAAPRATARVFSSGTISSHKGINLPMGGLAIPSMTEKDAEDLRFGLQQGIDWVALSFVRSPEDAKGPRAIMQEVGRRAPLLAKIEKLNALNCIDEIIDAFDGLMVARGDLGVEAPLERVPAIQKDLIRRANAAAKPVITATQMLLSMVASPRPTRAEVTDVANAILDGTDAVMLSEETAQGADPAHVVEVMGRIADEAEALYKQRERTRATENARQASIPEAIARATSFVAGQVGAKLIVTPTEGGGTARLIASQRPPVPILALSNQATVVRQLALSWGISACQSESFINSDQVIEIGKRMALQSGLAHPGDRILLTFGYPLNQVGTTNLLEVVQL